MTTVDELLQTPEGRDLVLVAGPWEARRVQHVAIVDSLDDLRSAPAGAVALLTPHASSRASGYLLDVALRTAGDRGLAAVAVYGEGTTSPTAIRLATRGRVALLSIARGRDLTSLAFGLERTMRQDAGAVLARALAALQGIGAAERHGGHAVLLAASAAVGVDLELSDRAEGAAVAERVVSDGRAEGFVVAAGPQADGATRLAVRLAAEAIGRLRTARRRQERAPARARGAAIGEILGAPARRLALVAGRARDLGVAVDGAHRAVRLEVDGVPAPALLDLEDELVDVLPPGWERTVHDDGLLLLQAAAAGEAEAVAGGEAALRLVERLLPGHDAFCGTGRPAPGAEGLRTSAAEAAATARAARALQRPFEVVPFGAIGVPRPLLDWLSSEGVQATATDALAALDALGPERAATAVRTLQVYLDERGSLLRTAERLHLHRNAVAYRMRRITEQLGVDLEDPDVRLTLQVACRARTLRLTPLPRVSAPRRPRA